MTVLFLLPLLSSLSAHAQQQIVLGNSASEIAAAVQAFGQEDDITVVSITRTPTAQPFAAAVRSRGALQPTESAS